MRSSRICLTLCTLMALLACQPEEAGPEASAAAQQDIIMNLESQWSALYGAGDLDGIVSLMSEDSVLIMPGSEPVVGLDAIRAATREMLESGDQVSWRSDFAAVAPSGDMAYDYGTAVTTLADGNTVEGNYLVVWVRDDGEWKVAADMFN